MWKRCSKLQRIVCNLYIAQEHKKKGRNMDEIGGGASSPHVHIRKLCGPGAYGGGTSDYADGDTASVATSGPRASTSVQEVHSIFRAIRIHGRPTALLALGNT